MKLLSAIKSSGADMVTVAVRRVNIYDKKNPILMDFVNPKKYLIFLIQQDVLIQKMHLRTLRLAREIGGWKMVKLEILGDKKTLYPDMIETIKTTKVLVKEGFKVLVYCTDDPLHAKKLEEVGASAIMPLAAPNRFWSWNTQQIKYLINYTTIKSSSYNRCRYWNSF